MAENVLQLNQDRTEVLVIGAEAQRDKVNVKLQALSSAGNFSFWVVFPFPGGGNRETTGAMC